MADKKEKKNEKKIERKKLTEDFDDEEFAKELEEATTGSDNTAMSDEEYARRLQQELNSSPSVSTPTPNLNTATFYKPQTSAVLGGTYAALPGNNSSVNIPSISMDTEMIAPSADYTLFLDLKKRSTTIKILAVIDFVFSLYALLFGMAWWLWFGILFGPVGWWGAHKFRSQLTLIYMVYLIVDILLKLICTFIPEIIALVTVFSLLVILIQLFILYYVHQFWKKVPKVGTPEYDTIILHSTEIPMANIR